MNMYSAYPCPYALIPEALCTSPNAFVREGSPKGTATILGMDIPFQSTNGVTIFYGTDATVGPD
jgi:hypothetical protein